MSFPEAFRNTNEQKAHDLVLELFNNKSASYEEDESFLQNMTDRADTLPILKGVQEGLSEYFANLLVDGVISEEDATKFLTGMDMARVAILAYYESEAPDTLPEPTNPTS